MPFVAPFCGTHGVVAGLGGGRQRARIPRPRGRNGGTGRIGRSIIIIIGGGGGYGGVESSIAARGDGHPADLGTTVRPTFPPPFTTHGRTLTSPPHATSSSPLLPFMRRRVLHSGYACVCATYVLCGGWEQLAATMNGQGGLLASLLKQVPSPT
jgi:hypothetical protein